MVVDRRVARRPHAARVHVGPGPVREGVPGAGPGHAPAAVRGCRASSASSAAAAATCPELQSQIDLEGVSDLVHLPGFLPDDRLRDTVHRAGCVVIPSLYEPFGIVALEALAGGAPLVVARTGGLAELIDGTGAGLLFEPGNAAELATCIETVLTDDALADEMRRRGAALLADRYSWGAIAGATAGVYAGHPSSRPSTPLAATRSGGSAAFVSTIPAHAPGSPLRGHPRHPPGARRPAGAGRQPALDLGPEATRLFARLWPGWRPGTAHPAEMVRTTPAERLAELAADPGIVNDLGAVSRRLQTALKGTTWFGVRDGLAAALGRLLLPRVRHQRGAARSTRAASACSPATTSRRRPTSACRWSASACSTPRATSASASTPRAGSRRASPTSRPQSLGLADTGVEVAVDLAGDPVRCHVWRADVGRIPLYLLDTDVDGNSPDGVAVTDRLYGGDEHHRLRQEIVLGIGGVRALRALGLEPDVFHTNEGHAGFLGLERVRELVAGGAAVRRRHRGRARRRRVHDAHARARRASTASRVR